MMRAMIALALSLTAVPAAAGKLADSYGHLTVSAWDEMSYLDRGALQADLAKDTGASGRRAEVAVGICISMIARDVRYKTRLMSEVFGYCVKNWKEFDK